jgi:hypothetical protein
MRQHFTGSHPLLCNPALTPYYVGAEKLPVSEREIIERYFQAMRTGAIASEDIIDLFAEEAVYVEPFSGEP